MLGFFPYIYNRHSKRYVFDVSRSAYTTTSGLEYHMNQVPFKWIYYGNTMDMLFVGGLIGVSSGADKALQPVFGYSIMYATSDEQKTENNVQ